MVAVAVASPSVCPLPDASSYAHFLFDAFDADRSGTLCFQVSGLREATQVPPPGGGRVPGTAAQPGVGRGGAGIGGNRLKIATSQNRNGINRNNRPRSMGKRTEGTGRGGAGTPWGCHRGPGVTQGLTAAAPVGFRRRPLAAAAGDGAPEAGVGLQPLRPQQGRPHQQGGDGGGDWADWERAGRGTWVPLTPRRPPGDAGGHEVHLRHDGELHPTPAAGWRGRRARRALLPGDTVTGAGRWLRCHRHRGRPC